MFTNNISNNFSAAVAIPITSLALVTDTETELYGVKKNQKSNEAEDNYEQL
jgi:N12 class adenine-specific DNA methylase